MFDLVVPLIAVAIGFTGILRLARGAIYLPMPRNVLENSIRLLEIVPGERAVDLGSGDGRVVIEMAKAGAEAHGYEHSWLLVYLSRVNIRRAGLKGKAFIHKSNFWEVNLAQFSIVTVFGIGYVMAKLEDKIVKEASNDLRLLSYLFPLPNMTPKLHKHGLYLYSLQKHELGYTDRYKAKDRG